MMGMIAHLMPFAQNTLVERWVIKYIFSNTKKSSLATIPSQGIQYKRRGGSMRTIIESQVQDRFLGIDAPDPIRITPP